MVYQFVVPGQPRGKGRPRFIPSTGRTYTDSGTREYEKYVKACCPIKSPLPGGVKIQILALREIPKSYSNKKREAMQGKWCLSKPDIDNIEKIILDALNGIAFYDDSCVCSLQSDKRWDKSPGVIVRIESVDGEDA